MDSLLGFPFLSPNQDLVGLKATYMAGAKGVDSTAHCVKWWKQHATLLPAWAAAEKNALAAQPSSAVVEQAFSLLNSTLGDKQDNSLKDYIETSVMLRYNKNCLIRIAVHVCNREKNGIC